MLHIKENIGIPEREIELQAIRSSGAGGQHVNKVSTAIHLRFDVNDSSLPQDYKDKITASGDSRVTGEGVVVIKAQGHRSRRQNKKEAYARLRELVLDATVEQKKRVATKPSLYQMKKRMDCKTKVSKKKSLRGRVKFE